MAGTISSLIDASSLSYSSFGKLQIAFLVPSRHEDPAATSSEQDRDVGYQLIGDQSAG